jgi:hypothetical protein
LVEPDGTRAEKMWEAVTQFAFPNLWKCKKKQLDGSPPNSVELSSKEELEELRRALLEDLQVYVATVRQGIDFDQRMRRKEDHGDN